MENQRTIQTILSLDTGEILDADTLFYDQKDREDEIFQLRTKIEEQIQNGTIYYVCLYCKQPVAIRGRKNLQNRTTHFYFTHPYKSDDCFIKTESRLTEEEVRCIKYNGVKESNLHNTLKNEIAYYLGLDKNISVIVDEVYKDKTIPKQWRKPDVLAKLLDREIAFELQLSTTFLSVIVGRTLFYKRNGIFLIWIFHEFTLENDLQKFTQKDVYYNNNFNVYVFDEFAKTESIKEKELILKCYYKEYSTINDELHECWVDKFIRLTDLTFDNENIELYFYNSISEKQKNLDFIEERRKEKQALELTKKTKEKIEGVLTILRQFYKRGYPLLSQKSFLNCIETEEEVEELNRKLQFSNDKTLFVLNMFFEEKKELFLSFICNEDKILVDTSKPFNNGDTILARILSFELYKFRRYATLLFRKGYILTESDKSKLNMIAKNPTSKEENSKWIFIYYLSSINNKRATEILFIDEKILNPLYSLKIGLVIGSGFNSLLQVCNNAIEYHKPFGDLFIRAMKVYGRYDKLLENDKKGSLKSKLNTYYSKDTTQDFQYDDIIYTIFPELKL